MNKKFLAGLATALMTTVGTTTLMGISLQVSEASNARPQVDRIERIPGLRTLVGQESPDFDKQTVISLGPITTDSNIKNASNQIATLYVHQWQEQLAVTLRIRKIPVLTFLGSKADLVALKEQGDEVDITKIESEAVKRAKAFAKRLNKLNNDNTFKAENLTVALNRDQTHSIKLKSEELIKLDKGVILPDTTRNQAVDALQATNRLRRLMGSAPPLTAIVKPKQPSNNESGLATVRPVTSRRKGMASWYGPGFHGRLTANGERYNQNGLTAAHKTLPFGTQVRVTNLNNGRSVIVRINDRGPFVRGRVIDLSRGAASVIGLVNSGVAPVQLEILGR